MKWVLKEINVGDAVRVNMGLYYHYGICTAENKIVQFGYPILNHNEHEVEVCSTDVNTFLCGKFAEVMVLDKKELKKANNTKTIIEKAEQSTESARTTESTVRAILCFLKFLITDNINLYSSFLTNIVALIIEVNSAVILICLIKSDPVYIVVAGERLGMLCNRNACKRYAFEEDVIVEDEALRIVEIDGRICSGEHFLIIRVSGLSDLVGCMNNAVDSHLD